MTKKSRTRSSSKPAALSLLLLFGVFLPACDEAAAVAILVSGPPKNEALFELDKRKTTTILVEDGSEQQPISRAHRASIAKVAEELLVKKADLKDMVSGASALRAASGDRNGKRLTISEIGRSLKADVVIHVFVKRLSITPDGATLQPVVDMDVRVVDARTGQRLWPLSQGPHRVRARQGAKPSTLPPPSKRGGLESEAARWAGHVVAELFYKHDAATAANKRRP